jgi:type II secretory pathway component PulF
VFLARLGALANPSVAPPAQAGLPFELLLQGQGLLAFLLVFGPSIIFCYAVFESVALPFRRMERARFFLDLLADGLKSGQSPERLFAGLARNEDKSVPKTFNELAAHLRAGLRLQEALNRTPDLLPARVAAVLKVGDELGDLSKVLPVCQRMIRDGQSQVRSALNYLLAFLAACLTPGVCVIFLVFVEPRMRFVFLQMAGPSGMDLYPGWLARSSAVIAIGQIALVALVVCAFGARASGGTGSNSMKTRFNSLVSRLSLVLPWRRKRLERDFAGLLAALLDADIPEQRAIRLAARATGNTVFIRRADLAEQDLGNGRPLVQAMRRVDGTLELEWRLKNASAGPGGFRAALGGWLECLDAAAFQKEQAFSQLATTGWVLLNGVMVGLVAAAVFVPICKILDFGLLW